MWFHLLHLLQFFSCNIIFDLASLPFKQSLYHRILFFAVFWRKLCETHLNTSDTPYVYRRMEEIAICNWFPLCTIERIRMKGKKKTKISLNQWFDEYFFHQAVDWFWWQGSKGRGKMYVVKTNTYMHRKKKKIKIRFWNVIQAKNKNILSRRFIMWQFRFFCLSLIYFR